MSMEKLYITVIMATYNRCESLKEALLSLINQECDGSFDYEIIVVDNNSKDQTKMVLEYFISSQRPKIRYVFEPLQGKSYAMNNAIGLARGEILAFTDDDVIADSKWLLNIKRCFEEHQCDGLGGRILPDYPPGRSYQWVKDNVDILMGAIVSYDYGEEIKAYTKPLYEFFGANFAFRKKIFEECGLFRTDLGVGGPYLGEDTEYVNRLEKKNKKLYYCGKALIWHPVDIKRLRLGFIARWNMTLGRYRVFTSEYKALPDGLVYYFGVPQYLILEMFKTLGGLMANILNKREFLKHWIRLSIDWGRAFEIRLLKTKVTVSPA